MKEPQPRLIRSPRDAEVAAADWMVFWGYTGVRTGQGGPDEGVDVRANEAVAQVKAEMQPVGRPVVQQTAGIALHEVLDGLVFSLSGFTDGANQWALDSGIALFTFDLQGVPEPANISAREILERNPKAWAGWIERGWQRTQDQVCSEILHDLNVREMEGCSWSSIWTADGAGRVSFSTTFLSERELEEREGPVTRRDYANRVVLGNPWFAVDIEVDASVEGRIAGGRFDPFRPEHEPYEGYFDDDSVHLRRVFRDHEAREAAGWIAEVAIALQVSPYRERWPEEGWEWSQWTSKIADEYGWP